MRSSQGQAVHLKHYREPDYWVKTVDLNIQLEPEATRVTANLSLQRNKQVKSDCPVRLDGDEVVLKSVSIDGKRLSTSDYQQTDAELVLKTVPKKRSFKVTIETEVNPTANTKLMGLYRSGGNYCTQCEAEGFRRITFFPDRPDILAVYTTRIEADKLEAPILLGNGNLVKKGSAGKGRHYAIWHDPHPKPSYLFAVVGGDLGSIHKSYKTASGKKVKLGIYVEKGKEAQADYAMDALVRSMRWDEQVFGCEYDLDVFNIVAVSDFNMGAMENKGLNIFNDKYVLGDPDTATDADFANIEAIIAHEYFHNWTGNRITCRDWFQLCLKEGLTVFRDQEFSSDERSRPVKRISDVKRLKANQFPEDAGPLAHPVRPETYHEINNFYTATVYEKGAELVRMLATVLGEKLFRKGMARYLKRHDGDAATIEDFIACFEQAAKTDLSQFMNWYSQAGTPILNVSSSHDRAKQRFTVEIEQITPPTPGQSRKAPHIIPQRYGLYDRNGERLSPSAVTGVAEMDGVFYLTKRKHKVVFEGVERPAILSLNNGFTAPVEIDYRQSDAELALLAGHDEDSFSRWQAYQTFATRLLISATRAIQQNKQPVTDERFLSITCAMAKDESLEPAFRSSILTLPSEAEIAQAIGKNVDPGAIAKAHSTLAVAMGKALETDRSDILETLKLSDTFTPDAESAGKRSLVATLMRYGVLAKSKAALEEITQRYASADNLTDRFNTLCTIVWHHPDRKEREGALTSFYERYKSNHIVLDKWFSVQAMRSGASTVSSVKSLMRHDDFSLKNPNRLRSLIGVFAMANPTAFNAPNGAGYKLVGDVIMSLDDTNPQVAARLLTAFRSYKSLEAGRRKLAVDVLKRIEQKPKLSPDVADIVNRTLAS